MFRKEIGGPVAACEPYSFASVGECCVADLERHWLTGWLERERGLAYANTQIVSKPVGHFLKGITVFEAPSENGFHGAWQISHLWAYRQYDLIDGSIGPDLPFFRDGPVTIIEVANVPKPLGNDAFRDHLDRITLPFLASIDSMDRLYQLAMHGSEPISSQPEAHFRLEVAMGNFVKAQRLLSQHRIFEEEAAEQHRQLCRLLDAGNLTGIALFLHDWEAMEAECLGVEHLWEPSPFPFEPHYDEWLRRTRSKPD